MRSLVVCCILFGILVIHASASLAIYEAGKAAICIDDKFEKTELGSMFDVYPTLYFEPITSREQVRDNEYTFMVSEVTLTSPSDIGFLKKPIWIKISDKPFDINTTFTFPPNPIKTVPVGRLGLVNTTLYNGSWAEQTPHLVFFAGDGFNCCIYGQDIKQNEMEDFLKKVDIINKNDLATFLPSLWTELAD